MKPAILVCGQTGTGKSSIVNFRRRKSVFKIAQIVRVMSSVINFLLRKPAAKVGNTAESVRRGFPPPRYENDSIIFYDSDGYEINRTNEYRQKMTGFLAEQKRMSGVHLVWYTINAAAHRITDFDKEMTSLISANFPVGILLTKIDECDEEGLATFYKKVRGFIPNTRIFKVSTINGAIQKYAEWDALVEWTKNTLNKYFVNGLKEQKSWQGKS